MADWISFYDFKHSIIYVNERHRDVHYRTIAQDIRRYIPSPDAHVLDYGSGEATSAALVAEACGTLAMAEAAPNVRASLTMRYAGNPKITVVTPEGAAALTPHSLDLIVMHSVAQYLSAAQLDKQLAVFRKLVKPGGLLIVGDVVPPNFSAPAAAVALLRFGARNGFLGAAVFGLIRIVTSDYLRLRRSVGLSRYPEADMIEKLRVAGFAATRADHNIGHNQWRMTFLARPQ